MKAQSSWSIWTYRHFPALKFPALTLIISHWDLDIYDIQQQLEFCNDIKAGYLDTYIFDIVGKACGPHEGKKNIKNNKLYLS